ncbi:MAG: hypothetical protein IPM82_05505 [Saprospiraceae bacterium]|nr:hypothetical protein [Saprospiraceae bacterium]
MLDEKGEPLPFATMLLSNGNGAEADFDGIFRLKYLRMKKHKDDGFFTGHQSETILWRMKTGKPINFKLKAGIELGQLKLFTKWTNQTRSELAAAN